MYTCLCICPDISKKISSSLFDESCNIFYHIKSHRTLRRPYVDTYRLRSMSKRRCFFIKTIHFSFLLSNFPVLNEGFEWKLASIDQNYRKNKKVSRCMHACDFTSRPVRQLDRSSRSIGARDRSTSKRRRFVVRIVCRLRIYRKLSVRRCPIVPSERIRNVIRARIP
jgi:hypothetical protein